MLLIGQLHVHKTSHNIKNHILFKSNILIVKSPHIIVIHTKCYNLKNVLLHLLYNITYKNYSKPMVWIYYDFKRSCKDHVKSGQLPALKIRIFRMNRGRETRIRVVVAFKWDFAPSMFPTVCTSNAQFTHTHTN